MSSDSALTWSIVIPAYNEASRLPFTLADITERFQTSGAFEVIVVDDGSSDHTAEVAESLANSLGFKHKIISHPQNLGKGAAIRTGMAAANGKWLILMDADNAVPISNCKLLEPHLKKYPVVIGSKYREPIQRHSAARTLLARAGHFLISAVFGMSFRDTQCGFKIIEHNAAKTLLPDMHINGWMYDVELLSLARLHRMPIKEVSVEWTDTSETRVRLVNAIFTCLGEVIALKYRLISINPQRKTASSSLE